ncbi:MAG: AbrB/MazE/SpoVT family DNA-binding domain-containing protein [Candidatus Hodarchaeales archaeon]|jgi:AbrB family looped-hinge helix DNA binding protein
MAIVLDLDDRGRITIPKEWREKLSLNRVVAIHTKKRIFLIPISSDPLKVLKGAFTTKKTTEELKKEALDLILNEINSDNQRNK